MSWNPRRLVSLAKDWSITVGDPYYFWLREGAVDRVQSAVDNTSEDAPTVLYTEALPKESILIGLEKPLSTRFGDVSMLGVPGLKAIHDNTLRASIQHHSADHAENAAAVEEMMGLPVEVQRPVALYDREGKHFAGMWVDMPEWTTSPETEEDAEREMNEMLSTIAVRSEMRPLLWGDEARWVTAAIRSVWTLLNSPEEREATETLLGSNLVHGSSKDTRDYPINVVDILRPTHSGGPNAAPSGTRRKVDHQTEVIGHWKMQAYGPGRAFRRKIYVSEYVRGPEDAPIRPKKPTVRVVRGKRRKSR